MKKQEEMQMKKWLLNHFLPMWAKETVLWENRQLRKENHALQIKVDQLQAYIDGVRLGLRAVKRGGQR